MATKRRGITRSTADRHYSKCVRLRTDWTCENCGLNFAHDIASLHCSHFISRKYKPVRHHPLNAVAHCATCHQNLGGGRWGGGNIAEFAAHYDEIYGSTNREIMRIMSKYTFRSFKRHEPLIGKHFLKISKEMEQQRMDGETGRIEFEMYEGCEELNALYEKLLQECKG